MKLAATETELVGQWHLRGTRIIADDTCRRIEELVSKHLVLLGSDASGWDDLYRDPDDGRLWERTWPQSEMHGGGPPRLSCLPVDEALRKYGTIVES
jgi:hypothetical protein